jgi:hypothetical protein
MRRSALPARLMTTRSTRRWRSSPSTTGASVQAIPIPSDCTDGFFEAYYAQPEAYLDAAVRAAQSVWPRLPAGVEQRAIKALQADLRSGAWDARHGHLRSQASYEGGLRLIVSHPARQAR